eukprot:c3325_g1_i1.p1 GENE.c3325_g1_i1~~c3325_g1_i1.p1  ORF type:complete len:426 (+),score=111.76 c3325_g1_i1:17-1294(+)
MSDSKKTLNSSVLDFGFGTDLWTKFRNTTFLQNQFRPYLLRWVAYSAEHHVLKFQRMCGVLPVKHSSSQHKHKHTQCIELWQLTTAPMAARILSFIISTVFGFSSMLGTEEFGTLIFSFVIWNVDMALGRKSLCIYVLLNYVGSFGKDCMQLPRPNLCCRDVTVVEHTYTAEHGFPSTHAMSVIGEFSTLIYFLATSPDFDLSTETIFYFCLVTFFLIILTCLSRMYRGVHSIPDLVGGITFSIVILCFYLPFANQIDNFFVNESSLLTSTYFWIMLLLVFPSIERHCTLTFSECACLVGVAHGLVFGSALVSKNYFSSFSFFNTYKSISFELSNQPTIPTSEWLKFAFFRYLLGLFLFIFTKIIGKTIVQYILSQVLPKSETLSSNRYLYQIPRCFLTYTLMGIAGSTFIPCILNYLVIAMSEN